MENYVAVKKGRYRNPAVNRSLIVPFAEIDVETVIQSALNQKETNKARNKCWGEKKDNSQ